MRLIFKVAVIAIFAACTLLVWAPWITKDYAIGKVFERLGVPEAHYYYFNQDMAVKDVPKEVSWFPFGRFVYFPGRGWMVCQLLWQRQLISPSKQCVGFRD